MAVLSWTVFGVLALLWTGGAWLTAAATEWIAQSLATGGAVQAARDAAALPVPDWARLFIDPAWLEALQSAVRWALDLAGGGLPLAATVTGWVVPVIWIGWGLGMLVLLAGAIAVHLLVRRMRRPQALRAA